MRLRIRLFGLGVAVALLVGNLAEVAWAQAAQPLIPAVRAAIARQDYGTGERLIREERDRRGITPEVLEAMSWLGRGALAAKEWARADKYARDTYELSVATLKTRPLDAEPRLPIALGAAIEVRAQVAAQTGARSEAVALLQREVATYRGTSIVKRLQKNINLLSLEGTPAPALDLSESLVPRPLSLDSLEGRVVVLFFWAHWCPDCKAQAPILAALSSKYSAQGLSVVAPTQRYGYVAGGRDANAADENRYIAQVRSSAYAFLPENAVPLSEANHLRYGVSTTPTLVVVDRKGIVRAYHPGNMTEAELDSLVRPLLAEPSGRVTGQ